ncbi:ALBINO3 chloroplastic [Micractinium conductrix]|uniref:ALBINO3 chloroplastic n=1 Tax=Micractinium conductrix TaxID=554055 RepID=A0A2P6VQW6_9CHLO|nr:ALBINO3 chloroplastic [Micractinium conductrix]|eukprot:PSC76493.1 ALBINO3 chloroplastic [Micractinium conductrix]
MALAGPRAARLLRWAAALDSPSLAACRGFSASALRSGDAGQENAGAGVAGATEGWGEAAGDGLAAGGDTLAAGNGTAEAAALGSDAALAAAADGAAALTEAAGGAAAELSSGVVLSATMAAVDGMHAATGLPWWATIASVGVLVRAAMLPISLQGMRASASLMPLLRQAREELAAEARPPLPPASPPRTAEERREAYKQQRWQRAQQKGQTSSQQQEQQEQQHAEERQQQQERLQAPPPPSTAAILDCFGQLRRAAGAPHPIWALASPLAQLPVFVTAMATVRTMSLNSWPGFREGGAAWFTDLTLPAMDLTQWVAPLGTAGVVLPAAITLSMLANIDAAFSAPAGSRQQASVMLYVMGGLRLFLEWMMVPMFAIALQLPQGALCYWATSSTLALAQNYALRQPGVRQLAGLPVAASEAPAGSSPAAAPAPAAATADAAAAAAAAIATGAAGPLPAGVNPELRQFLLTTSDQAALFERAAALRSEGRAGATSTVLQRILQLYPGQPNALYALGQVHAALKDWPLSEQYFLQAAKHQQLDAQSRARSWFGAAVALHMQGEDDTAIDAFKKAADAARTDDLRVRCWVSQATLHRKLRQYDPAVRLLRKAARAEPKVEEAYLKPLLAEMAGGPTLDEQAAQQQQQQPAAEAEAAETEPPVAAERQGEK